MLNCNIRYYRVSKKLTLKGLANAIGKSPECVLCYETGEELPDLATARRIASELGVRLADLMSGSSSGHKYEHGGFLKSRGFGLRGQERVKIAVEDYLDRFFAVAELIGGKVLRDAPKGHKLKPSGDADKDALKLRRELGFADGGAIPNLFSSLEDKGILIIQIKEADGRFSGMNGLVDGRPYVALNSIKTVERQRSTLVHELGHIYFERPCCNAGDWERYMTAVGGAFLFPADDVFNKLGERRSAVSPDMLMVCAEYGISLPMLMKRTNMLGIVSDSLYRRFKARISCNAHRRRDSSGLDVERARLFERLVIRGIYEGSMTEQKGAELLRISCAELLAMLEPEGVL